MQPVPDTTTQVPTYVRTVYLTALIVTGSWTTPADVASPCSGSTVPVGHDAAAQAAAGVDRSTPRAAAPDQAAVTAVWVRPWRSLLQPAVSYCGLTARAVSMAAVSTVEATWRCCRWAVDDRPDSR